MTRIPGYFVTFGIIALLSGTPATPALAQARPAIPPLPRVEEPPLPSAPAPVIEAPPAGDEPAAAESEAEAPGEEVPAGARIPVRGFRIQGIVERPEYGIERAGIEQIARDILAEHRAGFGIRDLRKLTQAITRHYRNAGLFLARAYIPEQEVLDGVIEVRVIEGLLADVIPQNSTVYDGKRLTRPFGALKGRPVHAESIEHEVLRLNRLPGLSLTGVFRPGETLGTTALLLDVRSQSAFDAYAGFDNHGSELTGEYRANLAFRWNNTSGIGDQLRGTLLQTFSPANNTYASIGYSRPVISRDYRLDLRYVTNSFTVGQILEQLDIQGESTIFGAELRRDFIIERGRTLYGWADFSRKSARSSQAITDIGEDELTVLSAGAHYEFQDRRLRGSNLLRAGLALGLPEFFGAMDADGDGTSSRSGGSGERAGGDFSKVVINYSRLQALPEIPMFRNQNLLLRVSTQFSGDLLTSLEQMPLGGPGSVRAYPVSEYLADTATLISAEWLARTAPGAVGGMFTNLRLSAFFDYARGSINDPLANETSSVTLMGTGIGLRFTPRPRLEAKVEFATAIGDPEPSNGSSLQTFFSLLYTF